MEQKAARKAILAFSVIPEMMPSSDPEKFVWPTQNILRTSQEQHIYSRPQEAILNEELRLYQIAGKIWIPTEDVDVQLKVLVVSHCGIMGHSGVEATSSTISELFVWDGMSSDVEAFVGGCIHCIVSRAGQKIPRPLASALHGSRPGEVVHMEFLYLGPSTTGQLYVLILRNDFPSFVWLFSGNTADSDTAVDAIAQWIGTFGCMDWIVSDQGSHLKNKIMEALRKWFRFSHHFTTAYTPGCMGPWANGTVERVCREVKRACMTLLSEWRLSPREWPSVTECVQSILNQAPLKRLGNITGEVQSVLRCPLEVFTGMRPCRPLMHALHFKDHGNIGSHYEVRARQLIKIEELQGALGLMHKDVSERVSKRRKNSIKAHNKKTNIQSINFSIGDFVLVRVAGKKGHKLEFHW